MTRIRIEDNALAPDVCVDIIGDVHVVYGKRTDAYYMRSTDDGATFTAPVKVNREGTVETRMGERGPKVTVAADGTIHVAYMDAWKPGAKTYARYTSSHDGGKTFALARAVSSMSGIDGVTLCADDRNVLVFWHAEADPGSPVRDATRLQVARSADGGTTWTPTERVKIANFGDLACSMCMMRARITPAGEVVLAFRTAENNVRDFWVLRGKPQANLYTATRVNTDNWTLPNCPMCGPELTLAPDGALVCAFMSRNRVYWSSAPSEAAGAFKLHVATPEPDQDEIYPAAVANRKGEVLLLWQVGPMSTTETALVKWAIYNADGTFGAQQGVLGKTTSGTKATAFVGRDGGFRVITTAK